jgi:hypothetical protein
MTYRASAEDRPPGTTPGRRRDAPAARHYGHQALGTTTSNERSPDVNSVTALMVSRAIEQDRRRGIERRPQRLMKAEPKGRPAPGRRSWTFRLPRLGLAGSKA